MGFFLLFWRKSFFIQSFTNESLCSLHLIYFSINLCAQFKKLPFKREKMDQTEFTKLYVCQCVLYLIASLFVWMHRSGTYWWFSLVYSFGKWTCGLIAKKPECWNNLYIPYLSVYLAISSQLWSFFNGTMRSAHTHAHTHEYTQNILSLWDITKCCVLNAIKHAKTECENQRDMKKI